MALLGKVGVEDVWQYVKTSHFENNGELTF